MSTAIVYRTAPMMEHKAAAELRQHGIRAYVPRDRGSRRSPFTGKHAGPAPGYVFARAAYSNAFAKHCKGKPLGTVSKAEMSRLYLQAPKRRVDEACPYVVGQQVRVGELSATVMQIRGRICVVVVSLFGKTHSQAIPYAQLKPG